MAESERVSDFMRNGGVEVAILKKHLAIRDAYVHHHIAFSRCRERFIVRTGVIRRCHSYATLAERSAETVCSTNKWLYARDVLLECNGVLAIRRTDTAV